MKLVAWLAMIHLGMTALSAAESAVARVSLTDTATVPATRWSEKMAHTVMQRNGNYWSIDFGTKPTWGYTYGLVMKALWEAWESNKDPKIFDYIEGYYDRMIDDEGRISNYDIQAYNIDQMKPGSALMSLYSVTKKQKYKTAILTLRQQMKHHPRTSEGGYWHKKVYPNQMWLDGLYMGSPFLAQYAKEFDEPALFEDVADQIILMEQHARDPKTGLLYHGWDKSRQERWADPQTGQSRNFWGRGVGWYAMAVVDVLDYLPPDHPKRPCLIAILNRLLAAVAKVQDPASGLWYQVLDQGMSEGNFLESTASSMFVYALAKAVRKGYADEKYLRIAHKGYEGILREMISLDANALINILQCCQGAGLGGKPYRDGTYKYYVHGDGGKVRNNDPKAIGPFILASLEFELPGTKPTP